MPEWDEQGNLVQEWDEQGKPWKPDSSVVQPRQSKPLSTWEKIQQQSTGFLSGLGQELPNVATRFANLGSDVYHGWKEKLRDAGALSSNPADVADEVRRAEREWKTRQAFEKASAPVSNENTGMGIGRIAARAAPQLAAGAAAAVASGGTSIPAQLAASIPGQAAVGGSMGLLQSLSEGASPVSVALQTGLGAGAPYAGQIGNGIGSYVKAPFKKYVDPKILAALERLNATAAKTGGAPLELPASAITNLPLAQNLERAGAQMIGGGRIAERGTKALADISERAGEMGADANPMLAGRMTATDYGTEVASLRGIKNAKYGAIGDQKVIPAGAEETLQQIDDWLSQGTLAPDVQAKLRALRAEIAPVVSEAAPSMPPEYLKAMDAWKRRGYPIGENPNIADFPAEGGPAGVPRSVADITSQRNGIRFGGPNASGEKGIDNRLRSLLGEDINSALEPVGKARQLAEAKAANANYEGLKESDLGSAVDTYAPGRQFDQIPKELLKKGASATDLKRLMEVTTPETQNQIREVLLQQIVGDAKNVTPKAIKGRLYQYRDVAKAVLTTEQLQALEDISVVREAMGKTTIGSPTAPMTQARKYIEIPAKALIRSLMLGGAGAAAGLPGLGVMAAQLGGEYGVAKALGSKAGQKWLTTGFGPSTLGGKLARPVGLTSSRIAAEVEMAKRRRGLEDSLARR